MLLAHGPATSDYVHRSTEACARALHAQLARRELRDARVLLLVRLVVPEHTVRDLADSPKPLGLGPQPFYALKIAEKCLKRASISYTPNVF